MSHDPISPNGVRCWGLPYHGLWKAGKVTLPNGSQVAMNSPVDGSVRVARVPGIAPVSEKPSDVAGGLQWLNYLIVNPSANYPGSKLSWVYTNDGPGKLVSIDTSYGYYGNGMNCTVLVPLGAEPSLTKQIMIAGLPGNASFRCANSDGSEAFFLDGYRGWVVTLSGPVVKNYPAHGLSGSAVCINPEAHQETITTNWYVEDHAANAAVTWTNKDATYIHSKYILHAAYDHNDNLVICWQESTYNRTRISVTYKVYLRDDDGNIIGSSNTTTAIDTREFTSSIVYGSARLYDYHIIEGGTWHGNIDGTPPPYQLPPPAGYVPTQSTSDHYITPNEGPSVVYDWKYISLRTWTNSVLGISIQDINTSETHYKNAVAPSGKSELFEISSTTPCFFTWHPVNDVLARDSELIAWV